jgi:hypothetical protein
MEFCCHLNKVNVDKNLFKIKDLIQVRACNQGRRRVKQRVAVQIDEEFGGMVLFERKNEFREENCSLVLSDYNDGLKKHTNTHGHHLFINGHTQACICVTCDVEILDLDTYLAIISF